MTKANEPQKLPAELESLLESWPVPERDEAFWDENAADIAARLDGARAESSAHLALLDAPLPKTEEDGSLEDRPSRSLVELARMSLEQDKADDAEAADIARESLSVARRSPVPSEPASQPVPSQPVPSQPVPSQPGPAPVAELSRARARKAERSVMGPMAMTVISVLGIAAAAIIVVRAQREAAAPVSVATAPPAPAASAPAAADKPSVEDDIFSIEELGPGKAATEPKPGAEKIASAPKPLAGGAKEAPPVATAPPETAKKPEAKPDKDEGAQLKPALTAGDTPDKPSTGAVQAAIGQVLGGARACVAGQSEPSKASVTFGSDGRVQSVAVSGPAAGTNAEACIRAALSKARVQPFSRPTFSVGATVRP